MLFIFVVFVVVICFWALVRGPKIVKISYHGDDWFTVHFSDKTAILAHYDCNLRYTNDVSLHGAQVTLQSGEVLQRTHPLSIPMQIRHARECLLRLQALPKIPQTSQKKAEISFP